MSTFGLLQSHELNTGHHCIDIRNMCHSQHPHGSEDSEAR